MANGDPGTDVKTSPWMFGLFAGIFSSANGRWVPMSQLRRFSSVGAWMLSFGMIAYGTFSIVTPSDFLGRYGLFGLTVLCFGMVIVALLSFLLFLWIGGQKYGVEEKDQESD